MIQSFSELGQLALPAWVISVTGAAMGVTKIALWIKQDTKQTSSNGNGKLLLAKEAGKFEGQVLALTERVVDLTEELHNTQKQDREIWAPTLTSLMSAQNRMMAQMEDHSKKSKESWKEMIRQFSCIADRIQTLPCSREEK
jgi:hypothetical protein